MTTPTQAQIEAAAKTAAEKANGGNFNDPLFYTPEQQQFWRETMSAALTAAAQVGEQSDHMLLRAAAHIKALLPFARAKAKESGDVAGIVTNAEDWLCTPRVINALTAAAQVGEDHQNIWNAGYHAGFLAGQASIKKATIERCAQVVENYSSGRQMVTTGEVLSEVAAAIRKLKEPPLDPNIVYPGEDPDFKFPEER